jgi:ketosteroid isomerase-like protein
MMKPLLPVLIIAIIMGCNNQEKVDTASEKEKLMQASRQWSQKAASRNVDSILSYWDNDALVISAGETPIKGKQGIRKMVEESFSNPNFHIEWEPESAEISNSGDMGYLVEQTKVRIADSTGMDQTLHFKTVTIWKKQPNGEWKNVVDVMSPLPQ